MYVNARYNVKTKWQASDRNWLMKDGWFDRLARTVEEDRRSMRALSIEAGHGPNFVSQMFKDGKEPGGEKLMSLLEVLGAEASAYVLLGIKVSADEMEMLRAYSKLDAAPRQTFRTLLETLSSQEADELQ